MKKTRKIRLLAFILTLSLTIGALPLYVFADEVEEIPEELQDRIVEEIPFEPEYLPGDLTFAECRTATLNMAEVPAVISQAQIEQYQHVNRLYEQEPDLYTVIFQNRDGSKTVYVFAQPVKSVLGNGAVTDMSAAAIVSAHQPALPSQNAMMQNSLSQNIAPILAMQERLDAYKAANDLKDYQLLDDVLEATTVNASNASVLVQNNSVSVASVSTTYSPLSGEYAIKLPNNTGYLTCEDDNISAMSAVGAPYGKWLLEYHSSGHYSIQSQSKQGYYLSYVDGNFCGLAQWEENDEGNETVLWSIYANNSETGYTIAVGGYALADNAIMISESYEPVCELTNHTTFIPLNSVSIDSSVITITTGESVSFPTKTISPTDASYANPNVDFTWVTTNKNIVNFEMDEINAVSAGVVQIYCKHKFSGTESNRVTVIVSETPPAGEAITSGAVYLIRPYSSQIGASTPLLTMNIGDESNTLSFLELNYAWGNKSQGFTITNTIGEYYRISAVLGSWQYDSISFTYTNKHTKQNTLYLTSDNVIGLKVSASHDGIPNNTDLTQQWKICDMGNYYVFVNANNPNYIMSQSFVAVSMVNTTTIPDNCKWHLTRFGLDVPCINQVENYYCPAASMLQALYCIDETKAKSLGNSLSKQLENCALMLGLIDENKTSGLSPIAAKLNYLSSFSQYNENRVTSFANESVLVNYINVSLSNGHPVLASVYQYKGSLPYYPHSNNWSEYSHIICIIGYDPVTGKIAISDCNYDLDYFGIYFVTPTQLKNALKNGIVCYR